VAGVDYAVAIDWDVRAFCRNTAGRNQEMVSLNFLDRSINAFY
jgi:hypothetical protein